MFLIVFNIYAFIDNKIYKHMIIIYTVVKQAVTSGYIKFAFLVLLVQAFTSASILLDVPVLRQVLGFACFIALLGMVTLPLIKIKCSSAGELLVFSCGLGLIGLMVIGLIMNTLCPILAHPLSLMPMLAALNLYMVLALVFGLILKRDGPYSPSGSAKLPVPISSKYIICIAALPTLAVIGTWAMNLYGFNLILMVMILAIAIIFIIALADKSVHEGVYTLLILSASVSLLLLYSLRSPYLMGFDIQGEYYTFSLTLANYHWTLSDYYHIYNTCLSITILPTVLYSLLNIDPQYMFKLAFQIVFALMPLAVYLFFKEKIDRRLAFLATFFMISNYMFFYQMPGLVRQEIALLLFVLAIYVLFTDRIKKEGGVALFLIFSFGTVISHYTTAFVFFFILIVTYLATRYVATFKMEGEHKITAPLVIAVFAMILFWHGLISRITMSAALEYGINTLQSVDNIFLGVNSAKAPIASMILGQGVQDTLPSLISWGIGTLSRVAVVLGVLYVAYFTLFAFDTEYVIASLILVTLVVIGVLVPFMSLGYNLERLYMQALVFLAPMCIVALFVVFKNIQVGVAITGAGVLVAIFLLCQTGLLYQAFGMPMAVSLNPTDTSGYLIYPTEVAGAQWLSSNESPTHVYADNYGTLRLWSYGDIPRGYGYDQGAYALNSQGYGYRSMRYDLLNSFVYLDYYNVNDGVISDGYGTGLTPVSSFPYLDRLDQVYDNGGSEILKKSGRSL
jgi:uncharacterized membrane protein